VGDTRPLDELRARFGTELGASCCNTRPRLLRSEPAAGTFHRGGGGLGALEDDLRIRPVHGLPTDEAGRASRSASLRDDRDGPTTATGNVGLSHQADAVSRARPPQGAVEDGPRSTRSACIPSPEDRRARSSGWSTTWDISRSDCRRETRGPPAGERPRPARAHRLRRSRSGGAALAPEERRQLRAHRGWWCTPRAIADIMPSDHKRVDGVRSLDYSNATWKFGEDDAQRAPPSDSGGARVTSATTSEGDDAPLRRRG